MLLITAIQLCPECGSEHCYPHRPDRYDGMMVCGNCTHVFQALAVDVETED